MTSLFKWILFAIEVLKINSQMFEKLNLTFQTWGMSYFIWQLLPMQAPTNEEVKAEVTSTNLKQFMH